jgi:uncharacterized membrane protein
MSGSDLVNAGNSPDGHDAVFKYITTHGGEGLDMTDRWRAAQASLEGLMVLNGHPEMIPHAINWIAQMAHQGMLSNMSAGYQAQLSGNADAAAQYYAKAHAYFPDGTVGQFGKDGAGNVWGQQFDEKTKQPIGKPIQITTEMIATQMLQLQNPVGFEQALQTHQKNNEEINLIKAHAKYYGEMPAVREEAIKQTAIARDAETSRKAEADRARELIQQQTLDQKAGIERGNVTEAMKPIDKALADQAQDEGVIKRADGTNETPGDRATRYQLQKELMTPAQVGNISLGGANLNTVTAKQFAQDIMDRKMRLLPSKATADRPAGADYVMVGEDGKSKGVVSPEVGSRINHLIGAEELKPAATGGGAPGRQSSIGAGLNTQLAMQSGAGNLSGRTTTPMQPRQSQRGLQTVSQVA